MRVLFARRQFNADVPWSSLAPLLPGWDILCCPVRELADAITDADVVCPFGARINRELIASGRFGLIQQFGVGLDAVDLDAATEHGVYACRLPADLTGNADSVAELAVANTLVLLRRIDETRAALREGRWGGQPMGRSLAGARVLIVGLGAIGTAVAARLHPFKARITAVRAHPERGKPDAVSEVFGPDRLKSLVGEADVIISCAMLDATTRHLFDAEVIGSMAPGALFVNVARGGLVDETALLAALNSGRIAGAGLDVFAREPTAPDDPLATHPNVIATPHVGGLTGHMFTTSSRLFAENLLRWEAGEPPRWTANSPAALRR
jgi:phosphoglycerate dehydrogenase-like enzyme